jgi:creatinine amidohydrolase
MIGDSSDSNGIIALRGVLTMAKNLRSGILEEMTIDDVRAFKPQVVVLPLGSTEPHGPHLPYGTDTFQVTNVCRLGVTAANAKGARALLYPALPITNNANFRKFPFACRIGVRTLMSALVDIVTQCKEDGVMKVVIVNGHGGNPGAISAAQREIAGMDGMPFVCYVDVLSGPGFKDPIGHPSDHAGESETSRMMYVRPDLVRRNKLKNNPFGKLRVPMLSMANFVRPWHLYLPVSAGGETRTSSAAKGRALHAEMSKNLAQLLIELSKAKYDARFPYV